MKTLRHLALVLLAAGCLGAVHAQGLRPEIGKPLQQAGELLKAGKTKDALAKVREAEQVGGKSAAEQLMIDRMEAAVAQRAGDNATAARALEAIYPKVGGGEQAQTAESLAFAYAQLRDWNKSKQWADKAQQLGRNSPQMRQLVQYLQSQTGDYEAIGRDAAASVAAAERAGKRPDEGDLLRLADAQQRQGQTTAYIGTLEKLLAYHPKKEYWSAYLGRLTRKPKFSDRFGLDVLRLKLASGTLEKTEDFMEMAQLALQDRLPDEALKIIDKGFAGGMLGKGPEADRHQRLKDLALKRQAERKAAIGAEAAAAQAAKDGNELVQIGYAYVTMGEVDRGIALIEQALATDNLKRPEDARLRLGMAQLQSPATRAKGLQTLRKLKGDDGVAEIGRLWTVVGR